MFLQEALLQERAIDDRIIYKLNTSVPTESFTGQINAKEQCMTLYKEVYLIHDSKNEVSLMHYPLQRGVYCISA